MLKVNVVMWHTYFNIYMVLEICPGDPCDEKWGKLHWNNLNVMSVLKLGLIYNLFDIFKVTAMQIEKALINDQ